jgi:hypothetical protein
MSAALFASGRAWVRSALPVSSAMMRASSSTRASTASAIFCSMRPRSRGAILLQLGNALRAACTARLTSSAPPRGMLAMTWRLPGDSTVICSPDTLSTQLPSISICMRLPEAAGALLIATAIAHSSWTDVCFGGSTASCRCGGRPQPAWQNSRGAPQAGVRPVGAHGVKNLPSLSCCRQRSRRACRLSRTSDAARPGMRASSRGFS